MAEKLGIQILFRVVYTALILTAIIIRPSVSSLAYLFMACYLPFVSVPTVRTMQGHTRNYMRALVLVSFVVSFFHFGLRLSLHIVPEDMVPRCSYYEMIFRQIGIVKLNQLKVALVITWIAPEILMLCLSIGSLVVIKRLLRINNENFRDGRIPDISDAPRVSLSKHLTHVLLLVSSSLTAIMSTSWQGFIYMIFFVAAATCWASYRQMGKKFAIIMTCLLVLVFTHLVVLYVIQLQIIADNMDWNGKFQRMLALKPLRYSTCRNGTDGREIFWSKMEWYLYGYWIVLYVFYFTLAIHVKAAAITYRTTLRRVFCCRKPSTELKWENISRKMNIDLTTISQMEQEDSGVSGIPQADVKQPNKTKQILESLLKFVVKLSFIGTNVIMMAWSITFMSVTTFMLQLAGLLIWLLPNQRENMLRVSPFLVFYSWVIILTGYFFAIDFLHFPLVYKKVKLWQIIPINAAHGLPFNFGLLIKCLYTVMFLVTMRQHMRIKVVQKQNKALAQMGIPIDDDTALHWDEELMENTLLKKIIHISMSIMCRLWLWLNVFMLLYVPLSASVVTVFSTVYMLFFLAFVLIFQFAFRVWRLMIYGFFWSLIVVNVMVLVLNYTYQFETFTQMPGNNNFSYYWSEYLHIPVEIQRTIGLESYGIRQLFVRLTTPTFFVIVTGIQIRYFAKALVDIVLTIENREVPDDSQAVDHAEDSYYSTKQRMIRWFNHYCDSRTILLFAKLHMTKLLLLIAMMGCVTEPCAFDVPAITLICIALTFKTKVRNYCIYTISLITSVVLMLKMIYQTEYIRTIKMESTCYLEQKNYTVSLTEWMGLTVTNNLINSLKWHVSYVVLASLFAAVETKLTFIWKQENAVEPKHILLFPKINRWNADESVINMLKYLLNYGYYKLGYEISLITIVILIAVRMDAVASIHAMCLVVILFTDRSILIMLWPLYHILCSVLLLFQFIFSVVGSPPNLCIGYPWSDNKLYQKLQVWAYLPDIANKTPPNPAYLLLDFFVLLAVSRQSRVFRSEKQDPRGESPAGSNQKIYHLAEEPNFVNPIPDYINSTRSYLDLIKKIFFKTSFWVMLTTLFVTGTHRTDIFSVGYLAAVFTFYRHGTDMFLKPIPVLIKWLNLVLAYNLLVICSILSFQLVGCIILRDIRKSWCRWLKLFTIGCYSKYNTEIESECYVSSENTSIFWNSVAFAFLVFQRKIIGSYYFLHLINDIKISFIMGYRGPEIWKEIHKKDVKNKVETARKLREHIKKLEKNARQYITDPFDNHPGDYFMFKGALNAETIKLNELDYGYDEEQFNLYRLTFYGFIIISIRGSVKIALRKTRLMQEKRQSWSEGRSSRKNTIHLPALIDFDADFEPLNKDDPEADMRGYRVFALYIKAFLESILTSLTILLRHRIKKFVTFLNYLNQEKRQIKSYGNYAGERRGRNRIWYPTMTENELMQIYRISRLYYENQQNENTFSNNQPILFHFFTALWYFIISHSDNLVYIMVIVYQMKKSTMLSLPLPLMMIFWGWLTVPSPSRPFWMSFISFIEVIILIKCIFQLDFVFWKFSEIGFPALFVSGMVGFVKEKNYALMDLLLLVCIFFHRTMLKTSCLWFTQKKEVVELPDGIYSFKDGEIVPSSDEDRKRSQPILLIQSIPIAPCDFCPSSLRISSWRYSEGFRAFIQQMLDPSKKTLTDVYTPMFLCDIASCIILILCYKDFGLEANTPFETGEVSITFLGVSIMSMLLIVIDRGIYIRRNLLAKLILLVIQVIALHLWFFAWFLLIFKTDIKDFTGPQLYYLVKGLYFLFSAYQIRCGYSTDLRLNFACYSYGVVNMWTHKLYTIIPYLYEIRCVMDWMWTDTSLSLGDWLMLEEIHCVIFNTKCERKLAEDFDRPIGKLKRKMVKCAIGGSLVLFVLGVLMFPLGYLATEQQVAVPNLPTNVYFYLNIGHIQHVFKGSVRKHKMFKFSEDDYHKLVENFKSNPLAEPFFSQYDNLDITAMWLEVDNSEYWSVTPPVQKEIIEDIKKDAPLKFSLVINVFKEGAQNSYKKETNVILPPSTPDKPNPDRDNLLKMIEGESASPIYLTRIFPKFIEMADGKLKSVETLMIMYDPDEVKGYRNLMLTLKGGNTSNRWWELREDCSDRTYRLLLNKLPYAVDCTENLVMYTFNEKLFGDYLNTGSQSSSTFLGKLVSVYGVYFALIYGFIRKRSQDQIGDLWIESIPYTDRIYNMCIDVYVARNLRNYYMEDVLSNKLIFLFRSSELLIKFSRSPEQPYNPEFLNSW